jgi:predicted kinase
VKARIIILPATMALFVGGCAKTGDVTYNGITAVRSACPAVAVPAYTGDVALFSSPTSRELSALDVSALITNVRSTCVDAGENVQTDITFDVEARRSDAGAARDVSLPYFITVVQGGTAVVAKRVNQVTLHFDAGHERAVVSGRASAVVDRAAATLPQDIRRNLLRKRKAGEDDAAVDPLSRPDIKQAVQRATFEALVGFQLTDDQLKYNATR